MKLENKVWFISYGTGGSEIFKDTFFNLKSRMEHIDFRLISISEFSKRILKHSEYIDKSEIINRIFEEKPNLIVNEVSNGIEFQNKIMSICYALNIPIITILDIEGNYERCTSIPVDYILTPTDKAKEELELIFKNKKDNYKDNFNCLNKQPGLITVGNASFDRLQKHKYRRKPNIRSPKILYASQGKERMESFTDLYRMFFNHFNDFTISIKPHPQEDKNWEFKRIIDTFNNVSVINEKIVDFTPYLCDYDIVSGYNSTLNLQSFLIGIPTIFHQEENTLECLNNYSKGMLTLSENPYHYSEMNAVSKTINCLFDIINKQLNK